MRAALDARTTPTWNAAQPWLMWTPVALAYALAFFQRIAPQTIVDRLMADLRIGAAEIGIVTSAYFYGYMVMQLPAGVIVDQWGVRAAVLTSLAVSSTGTVWFAHAGGLTEAVAARALVALGDALVFTSLVKQAVQWFPAYRFGLMTGLGQLCGYLGGLIATTPLAFGVVVMGWRGAFNMLAATIFGNLLLSVVLLRNAPLAEESSARRSLKAVAGDAMKALGRGATWGPLTTSVGAYVASLSLAGVWGGPLLMQAYGLSRTAASLQMFALMSSYAAGALAFGYLSDAWFRTLRRPIIAITAIRITLLLLITPAVGGHMPIAMISASLVALGFLAGGMVPLVLSSLELTFTRVGIGTGVGINSVVENMANGMAQPLLGAVLEYHWTGSLSAGAKVYPASGYTWLLLALTGVSLLSILGPLVSIDKDRR